MTVSLYCYPTVYSALTNDCSCREISKSKRFLQGNPSALKSHKHKMTETRKDVRVGIAQYVLACGILTKNTGQTRPAFSHNRHRFRRPTNGSESRLGVIVRPSVRSYPLFIFLSVGPPIPISFFNRSEHLFVSPPVCRSLCSPG